ncbi:MAG: hypothetical protein ACRDAX_02525 [Propionibacteriaceae bacterium]
MKAPYAPGGIQQPPTSPLLLTYLSQLENWLTERRSQLDTIDGVIKTTPAPTPQISGPNPQLLLNDLMLAMSLWQAITQRHNEIIPIWNYGRVGAVECEKISVLIWGRLSNNAYNSDLDPALAGMNFSLPEACRLLDALSDQLTSAVGLNGNSENFAKRISVLKAGMERIRDQLLLAPAAEAPEATKKMAALEQRLILLQEKLRRGGDIAGFIEPLETDAALFERDLIVKSAQHREHEQLITRVKQLFTETIQRSQAANQLVEHVVATVAKPPCYAVPDPKLLGDIPNDLSDLKLFEEKLSQVNKALTVVENAYQEALATNTPLEIT